MLVKLAFRNIWRNKRRTIVTMISMAFGLALAIFFVSWGAGVYAKLIDQAVRLQAGHVTLEHRLFRDAPAIDLYVEKSSEIIEALSLWPEVEEVKPIIMGQGMIKSGAGSLGAAVMGVLPSAESAASPLVKSIIKGDYLADSDGALAVVGSKLAAKLNLGVGKKFVIATNDVSGNLTEELCRVKAIFETKSDEMDTYVIQVPAGFARSLFKMPEDSATQLGVILKKAKFQKQVKKRIASTWPETRAAARAWQEVMPEVASYIRMDRSSNWIFQAILLFLVLFTIFNTVSMSVLERRREFAILMAIGTRPGQLASVVFLESAFLGALGCLSGIVLGGIIAFIFNVVGIDLAWFVEGGISISGFAVSTRIFTMVTPGILFVPAALVFAATLLVSIFPMRRAIKIAIADYLR